MSSFNPFKRFHLMPNNDIQWEFLDTEGRDVVFIFVVFFPSRCVFPQADMTELNGIRCIVFKDNCVPFGATAQAAIITKVKFVQVFLKFAFVFPFILVAVVIFVLHVHQSDVLVVIVLENGGVFSAFFIETDSNFDACTDEAFDEAFITFLFQVTGRFLFEFLQSFFKVATSSGFVRFTVPCQSRVSTSPETIPYHADGFIECLLKGNEHVPNFPPDFVEDGWMVDALKFPHTFA